MSLDDAIARVPFGRSTDAFKFTAPSHWQASTTRCLPVGGRRSKERARARNEHGLGVQSVLQTKAGGKRESVATGGRRLASAYPARYPWARPRKGLGRRVNARQERVLAGGRDVCWSDRPARGHDAARRSASTVRVRRGSRAWISRGVVDGPKQLQLSRRYHGNDEYTARPHSARSASCPLTFLWMDYDLNKALRVAVLWSSRIASVSVQWPKLG